MSKDTKPGIGGETVNGTALQWPSKLPNGLNRHDWIQHVLEPGPASRGLELGTPIPVFHQEQRHPNGGVSHHLVHVSGNAEGLRTHTAAPTLAAAEASMRRSLPHVISGGLDQRPGVTLPTRYQTYARELSGFFRKKP